MKMFYAAKRCAVSGIVLLVTAVVMAFPSAAAENWNAVVKIFSVSSAPSYFMPWQNMGQRNSSASGFVISGNRIVTNAHAVAYGTFITVRKLGDQTQYPARVIAVNHDCDLALLTVEATGFFDGITPLETGALPPLQSSVSVFGYPVGGDNVSVTSGILSRIEPLQYAHSGKALLAAQVDAAINPGNSGGPVLHDGKVVGIAFQGLGSSQNIGYIIPCAVLEHFLDDLEDGKLDGFPDVPFEFEGMENPDLRAYYRMEPGATGVLVTQVPELIHPEVPLKAGDVVLAVDGRRIANDGTIDLGEGKVLFFGTIFWAKQLNESCPVTVWRDGGKIEVETRTVLYPRLVPNLSFQEVPRYFMAAGLLFLPLNGNYLRLWNPGNLPPRLAFYAAEARESADEETVVLSMVLADEANLGYQHYSAEPVMKVNGEKVRNLSHLESLFDNAREGYLVIELQRGNTIVLNASGIRAATERVMARYRIPSDRAGGGE